MFFDTRDWRQRMGYFIPWKYDTPNFYKLCALFWITAVRILYDLTFVKRERGREKKESRSLIHNSNTHVHIIKMEIVRMENVVMYIIYATEKYFETCHKQGYRSEIMYLYLYIFHHDQICKPPPFLGKYHSPVPDLTKLSVINLNYLILF